MGPNAPKKGLRFGGGFRDGLPEGIRRMCGQCPAVFELIVPPAAVNETRKALAEKGSRLNSALEAVKNFLREGVKTE